jgi:RNA polymerase sigma-70 factor (ECF subfamily)
VNSELYNEPALLSRIGAGDEQAFSQVVARYTSVIYAHLLIYLKDAQRAEEITQDIFMSIWRNREKLPGMENFPGYVYVITRNKVLTVIKEKVFATTEPPEDLLESLLTTPGSSLELKELLQALHKGIDLLPNRRKEVFRLSRLEYMSYDDIAAHFNISKNAVKQHITEALVFLRHYLKKEMDVIVIGLMWLSLAGT